MWKPGAESSHGRLPLASSTGVRPPLRAAGLLALALLPVLCAAPLAGAETAWELSRYRVRIWIAGADAPEITPPLISGIRESMLTEIDSRMGPLWQAHVETAPASVQSQLLSETPSLPASFIDASQTGEIDKWILLSIAVNGGEYEAAAREFDVRTGLWGTAVRRRVAQRGQLPAAAFALVERAFAPLALVEEASTRSARLRVRGSGLGTGDPAARQLKRGTLFRPVIRYLARDGTLRRQDLPNWTYLEVEDSTETSASVRIHTSLTSPLVGRRRGRVELLALAVGTPTTPTRLELVSRTKPQTPLIDYEVYAVKPNAGKAEASSRVLIGWTDRRGSLVVRPGPTTFLLLRVEHAGELMARLPVVPGLVDVMKAELPDDNPRLEAVDKITALQEELVDFVARRQVLASRARSRLAAGNIKEAEQLLGEFRRLAPATPFDQSVRQLQTRIASNDPWVQARINKLFADTQEAVRRFLDPRELERLTVEVEAARKRSTP